MRRTLLGLAIVTVSAHAQAWACPNLPPAQLESRSASNRQRPTNAVLIVRFARPFRAALAHELSLVPERGRAVPARVFALPRHRGLVRPTRLLRPNMRYRLVWNMSRAAQRIYGTPSYWGTSMERQKRERLFRRTGRFLVGSFRTGATADRVPPRWRKPAQARYVDVGWILWGYKSDAPVPPPPTRVRAWPQGFVDVRGASDDRTRASDLLFVAWVVQPGPTPELATGFAGEARWASGPALTLGDVSRMSDCAPRHQMIFPKTPRKLPIAVVAMDEAGNLSPPQYLLLDRRWRLWRPPRWK